MTRTRYYTASSVDGFIAAPGDDLGWLLTRDIDRDGPMNYDDFIADVGAIAMGSSTYRWVLEHAGDPAWSYDVPCWVFTHRRLPHVEGADIRFTAEPVPQVHGAMRAAAGERDIWLVGGGDLVGQFADHGLLDEVLVSFAPVTLGAGAPLLPRQVELRLTALDRNRDFACARYDVVRGV